MTTPEHPPRILPIPFLGRGMRLEHIHDPAGLVCEPHHHLYHELDYVLAGQGVFAVGGRKVTVGKGDVMYLARGVYHWRQSDPHHPLELCNLSTDDPTMRRVLNAHPARKLPEWPWWRHWTASDLNTAPCQTFMKQLTGLMQRRHGQLPAREASRLLPGIAALLGHAKELDAGATDLHGLARRVRQVPEQSLCLETEAQRLGITRWWLSRLFKRQFGITLWEHRNYARIDQAITRLLTTEVSVHDLGKSLGFASTAQFITTFTRLAGTTPARFRRQGYISEKHPQVSG